MLAYRCGIDSVRGLRRAAETSVGMGEPEAATVDRGSLRLASVAAVQHLIRAAARGVDPA
jgi:hypothetical protein